MSWLQLTLESDPESAEQLSELLEQFGAVSVSLTAMIDEKIFGQAIEKLKGVGVVLRDALFRPLKTFQETGERAIFDRNVVALTDVMFDPKFKPQLAKLRKINPNGPEAGTLLKEMLDAAKASAQTINE